MFFSYLLVLESRAIISGDKPCHVCILLEKKEKKKAEVALECSCLAAGAIRHPGSFHGSALINPARESSTHRPQQL